MNKLFLTDCDGVVLNWCQSIENFAKSKNIVLDFTKQNLGLEQIELDNICNDFNQDDSFAEIPIYADALEYMTKINQEFGYKFVGITTCLGNSKTELFRQHNINKLFGDLFKEVICLKIHHSKKPTFEMFAPTFYIDDKMKHVIDSRDAGHISFFMRHPYNIDEDCPKDIISVNNWQEIYNYLQNN